MKSTKRKKAKSSRPLESFANLDFLRRERTGIPEAIFAEGKTVNQIIALTDEMVARVGMALVTRVSAEVARELKKHEVHETTYYEAARVLVAARV